MKFFSHQEQDAGDQRDGVEDDRPLMAAGTWMKMMRKMTPCSASSGRLSEDGVEVPDHQQRAENAAERRWLFRA